MSARSLAGWLLCLVTLAAPWLLGAKVRIPGVIWVSCGLLFAAFLLTAVSLIRVGRFRPPKTVLACVAVLLGYLAVFAWNGEPEFATEFSKELFTELQASNPAGFIAPPWAERLALHAACLLSILTASQLARGRIFRRRMAFSFGFSALAVVAVSLMQRWAGLEILPWVLVEGTPERCNAGFFHYSATAACINLGWPFIVFSRWNLASTRLEMAWKAGIFGFCLLALVPLGAEAAVGVAMAMLLGGCVWNWLGRKGAVGSRVLSAGVVACLLVVAGWQAFEIANLRRTSPDHWKGAEETRRSAGLRDAEVKAKAMTRGDRIVVSESPLRPTLWLAGARMALDHPVIGEGPGSWPRRLAVYSNDPGANTFFHALQFTHNDLLQFAAEWGLVAAAFLLALLARTFLGGTVLPSLVLLGAVLHASVDFPMQCPALAVLVSVMIGWASRPTFSRPRATPAARIESVIDPGMLNEPKRP